jgi:hypothetical protein
MTNAQIIFSGTEADDLNIPSLQSTEPNSVVTQGSSVLQVNGFPGLQVGRSDTWSFTIDPWPVKSKKHTFLVLSSLRFTKAEASGKTFCILSANYEVQGWRSTDNSGRDPRTMLEFDILFKNSDGGMIWPVKNFGEIINCDTRSGYRTPCYDLPFESYDSLKRVTLMQRQSWWIKC